MARLEILLLGSPRAERDGRLARVDTRKATALLAYLAVTGQPHGRDALAGLLWPDSDTQHARAALRRTLSALGKAIGGEFLVADRVTVRLDAPDALIDVTRFDACLRAARGDGVDDRLGPLSEAVALYRGDFMAGFALRDADTFDEWQFQMAERLRRELGEALAVLARGCAEHQDLTAAVSHGLRWLSLDPLNEAAHRELMRAYAWRGQRTAALRQYRECVRVLDRELGVAPLEETDALYREVKEGRVEPLPARPADAPPPALERPATAARVAPPPQQALPLVGRDREWQQLKEACAAATVDGQLVAVQGEPGVGKSRLVRQFAEEAAADGASVVLIACYEGEEDLPYGVAMSALRASLALGRDIDVTAHIWAGASRLLPELAASPAEASGSARATDDEPGGQTRLLDAGSQLLAANLTADGPGILLIDDAHWADESSLGLLAYLARRLRGRTLCMVVTWRTEEVGEGHALRRIVSEAEHQGRGRALTLDRLDEAAVRELAGHALPALDEADIARLYSETEGVALFVVEYLTALASGEEAGWPAEGPARDLVAERVARTGETARQLLAAAAVIGRSFDLDSLRAASGRGAEETVSGVEELLARGLVREQAPSAADEGYDFTHDRLRAHVLAGTSLARRRLLHARVAAALRERPGPDRSGAAHLARRAWHELQAGAEAEAAISYALAGEAAQAVYANSEALTHLEAAIGLGHPDAVGLHERIADLHTLSGSYAGAVTRYETAAARATDADLARLEHKLGMVHHRLGAWDVAEEHYGAALALLGDETEGSRARIAADASLTAHRRGDSLGAQRRADRALAHAKAAGDEAALAQVHNLLGILATSRGDPAGAHEQLSRSLALAEAREDLAGQAAALNNLALAAGSDGREDEAIALAQRALELCVLLGDRHRQAAVENNLADLHRRVGETAEAEAGVRRAVEILAEIGADRETLEPEIYKLTEW